MKQSKNYEEMKAQLQQEARDKEDQPQEEDPVVGEVPVLDNPQLTLLGWAMRGGRVKRMHTMLTMKDHTLHEHTAKMLHIALALSPVPLSHHTMAYIMVHDTPELVTGDIPSPMKGILHTERSGNTVTQTEETCFRLMLGESGRELRQLSVVDMYVVQLADCIEFLHTCWEERMLGNLTLDDEVDRTISYIRVIVTQVDTTIQVVVPEDEQVCDLLSTLSERAIALTNWYNILYTKGIYDPYEKGLFDAVMRAQGT